MTAASTGGLGIAGFLKHTNDSGGGGAWLRQWRKKGVGEVTIWLHTRAPIVPCFSHTFKLEDEYEDKETGRSMPTLRFPRFVSPDAEVVHRNQYFRNDHDQSLQVFPDRDPFLLLREWLRFNADHMGLDVPVFKWNDEKNRQLIEWERGVISGLVKRGKKNFDHSLDTKLEYIYVVVDNDNVDAGPVLAREGKLVSQKIVEVIRQQQKQWGDDEGDPMQKPYAFLLVAKEAASPMNAYSAFKAERADFSDAVWGAISSEDFPDPLLYGRQAEGDMDKIRDAFEKAAQVELPLDQIFSDDAEVRRDLVKPHAATRPAPRESKKAQQREAVEPARKPAPPSRTPATPVTTLKPKPAEGTNGANPPGPQMRRRKPAAEPEPAPEAIGESIPCDECKKDMLATATVCPHCGTEYEPVADDSAPEPEPAPKPAPAKPKPVAAGASTAAAKPKPGPAAAGAPAAAAAVSGGGSGGPPTPDCWSCGAGLGGKAICPSCGIDQGDDIPFAFNEAEQGLSQGIGERWNPSHKRLL